ncbi:Hypothetical predicted protein [Olea europaea subsp. europaea]|uniref:Uncharacterized protein n=1 Tax=Olea europaea subsp. europaea TaxID=158383 RepID=A0A8S0SFC1_OLEEU|nr:Hypothetical predicted protein [Olea europaea subsp. europaea]
MNISGNRSRDKRKSRHGKDKGKTKKYGARDVSASLEQMVSDGTDLTSIARSHQKDDMSIVDCVSELLSSRHVEEGSPLHMFVLWFLRVKDNRNSYCAAKTPFLRFKFIEYCFEHDNQSFPSHTYTLEAIDGDIEHMSDWDISSDEDVLRQLEEDIIMWLEYCRIAERIVAITWTKYHLLIFVSDNVMRS